MAVRGLPRRLGGFGTEAMRMIGICVEYGNAIHDIRMKGRQLAGAAGHPPVKSLPDTSRKGSINGN